MWNGNPAETFLASPKMVHEYELVLRTGGQCFGCPSPVDGISWRIVQARGFAQAQLLARGRQRMHAQQDLVKQEQRQACWPLTRVIQTGEHPSLIPTDQHDGGILGTAVI